jgi:hypothetical protein
MEGAANTPTRTLSVAASSAQVITLGNGFVFSNRNSGTTTKVNGCAFGKKLGNPTNGNGVLRVQGSQITGSGYNNAQDRPWLT